MHQAKCSQPIKLNPDEKRRYSSIHGVSRGVTCHEGTLRSGDLLLKSLHLRLNTNINPCLQSSPCRGKCCVLQKIWLDCSILRDLFRRRHVGPNLEVSLIENVKPGEARVQPRQSQAVYFLQLLKLEQNLTTHEGHSERRR